MRQILAAAVTTLALTNGETWLLRSSVLLFVAMVAYCVWIGTRVSAATEQAIHANRRATDLDRRTAAIEERLGPNKD